jgi:hypothetical protein
VQPQEEALNYLHETCRSRFNQELKYSDRLNAQNGSVIKNQIEETVTLALSLLNYK